VTDDLEPRLRDHLRHRADRVTGPPDVADLHGRIDARQRTRTRALGAALALALVAGPLGGWALGHATVDERDPVASVGRDAGSLADDGPNGSGGGTLEEGFGYGFGYGYEGPMELVTERTTAEGIRLVVHTTGLGEPEGDPCSPDGVARVGIVDGDLVDVVMLETAPSGAALGLAGGAGGRPLWVVVARSTSLVGATFPNGKTDDAEPVGGVVVLAAYADAGAPLDSLTDDVVELSGLTPQATEEELQTIGLSGGCPERDPHVGPPLDLTMPEPGEPPAEEPAARAEIEELFSGYGGQDPDVEVHRHERPNVWRDADARFREEHPEYFEWAKQVYMVPLEIVFTAPDRASVKYELKSDNPEIPAPGVRIGEAVLIDGEWKVSIETACGNLALAGIECDYSIEG
jgi:hypothetical protein